MFLGGKFFFEQIHIEKKMRGEVSNKFSVKKMFLSERKWNFWGLKKFKQILFKKNISLL